jgi:hypothetical protein
MVRRGITNMFANNKNNGWLADQISTFFEKGEQSGWRDHTKYIHPSGALSHCAVATTIGLAGYSGGADGQGLRRMNNGTKMHERWEEYLSHLPSWLANELPIRNEEDLIMGTCDTLLQKPVTKELVVLDLKSVNHWGYGKLPNPGTPQENFDVMLKKYPGYVTQLLLYMKYVEWKGRRGAPFGFLLFENKSDQDYKLYQLDRNDERLEQLTFTARTGQAAAVQGIMPDPPYAQNSLECKGCWCKTVCFNWQNGDPETVKILEERLEMIKNGDQ